jgi:hypothetical protein
MVSSATNIVFKDGTHTFVRDGTTGMLSYSSDSSSSAIQYAINSAQNQSGGIVYLKSGTYFASGLNITKSNITLIGESRAILESSSLPILTVWGTLLDNYTLYNSVSNIHLSNLDLYYTGPVQSGPILYLHRVGTGNMQTGGPSLSNIFIHSSQSTIPTNKAFVGLRLGDVLGGFYEHISIYMLGTSVLINSSWQPELPGYFQADSNHFSHITMSYGYQGVYYEHAGHYTEIWDNMKIQYMVEMGVNGSASGPYNVVYNSPHFEDFHQSHYLAPTVSQIAIRSGAWAFTVYNGFFNGVDDYGLYLVGSYSATIVNCYFTGIAHCVYSNNANLYLIGNRYDVMTTKVTYDGTPTIKSYNDGYVLEAKGVAYISGGTYVTFAHGMDLQPIFIFVTFNNTAYGAWYAEADSQYITVFVLNSGYYEVKWYAFR